MGTHAVSSSGYALTGAAAGNYALVQPSATVQAQISAKSLQVANIAIASKVYDKTRAATVASAALAGVVSGDMVGLTLGSGLFADSAAGTHAVSSSGYALTGSAAGNYNLLQPSGTVSGTITAKPLDVDGVVVADKISPP